MCRTWSSYVWKKTESWKSITSKGLIVQKNWKKLADNYNLSINISGLPAISTYSFNSNDSLKYKTLITQEMLKKGILASTHFYACTEHSDENISTYFTALDEVYKLIYECESGIKNIDNLLEGPVCHSGFKRLN